MPPPVGGAFGFALWLSVGERAVYVQGRRVAVVDPLLPQPPFVESYTSSSERENLSLGKLPSRSIANAFVGM